MRIFGSIYYRQKNMGKRQNLLALPSTGRRSQHFDPIRHTEHLKAKIRYNIHKTLRLWRDRTFT